MLINLLLNKIALVMNKKSFSKYLKSNPEMARICNNFSCSNVNLYIEAIRDKSKTTTKNFSSSKLPKMMVKACIKIKKIAQEVKGNKETIDEDKFKHVIESIYETPKIDFSGHLGIINFPILRDSNLLMSLINKGNPVVNFVVAITPLNNISGPGSISFAGKTCKFFPKKIMSHNSAFTLTKGIPSNIKTLNKLFSNSKVLLSFNDSELKFLNYFFFETIEIDKIAEITDDYMMQMSVINYIISEYFYDSHKRQDVNRIYNIPIEPIIIEIMKEDLLDQDSFSYQLISDSKLRQLYLERLNGINACWDLQKGKGSPFFWEINNGKLNPTQYTKEGLILKNNQRIDFNPESIRVALINQTIFPTIFLSFMTLFEQGVIPLGGFRQIEYLNKIIKTINKLPLQPRNIQQYLNDSPKMVCGFNFFPEAQNDSLLDNLFKANTTDGKFNGNLNKGVFSDEKIDQIYKTPLVYYIQNAIELMTKAQ